METAFKDGTFTTRRVHGPPRWRAPLSEFGDTLTREYDQDYHVLAGSWTPPNIGESKEVSGNNYILTAETPMVIIGSTPIGRVTQTWTMVPRPHRVETQASATLYGLGTDNPYSLVNIDDGATAHGSGATTIVTSANHGLSVGHWVRIRFTEYRPDGTQSDLTIARTIRVVNSVTSVNVDIIARNVALWRTIQRTDKARDPYTTPIPCYIDRAFYLVPSAQTPTIEDIPALDPLEIEDVDGKRTLTASATSTPDRDAILAEIAAETVLPIEKTTIRKWRGPIFVAETPMAKIQ
jgi:hypothetical protein